MGTAAWLGDANLKPAETGRQRPLDKAGTYEYTTAVPQHYHTRGRTCSTNCELLPRSRERVDEANLLVLLG